jgi:hypothetical protein
MIAKFNPTGTHIHKGFLKVRIDLYPEPTDKTYFIHYVDKPDRPYTEDELENPELQALVPKHKELNPCLCHFIKVNPDTSLVELRAKVAEYFDSKTLFDLDDALSKFEIPRVSQIMKTKLGDGQVVAKFTMRDRDELNTRLSLMEIKV